jgi:hypothetical protein
MRKKVPTPQPRTTIVSGHEIVHIPFLEMLRDLLGSSKFTDVNNLCVNPSIADRFSQFVPTTVEDCSKLMSKQWANDTFASLEDFDPNNDHFFPIVLYANKTSTDVNQHIRWNHGCSPHPFIEGASVRVLLHGDIWGFFHPWTILASLLLKSQAQHQLKAKRSCNCIMTFCWYFFRKLNMWLQTSR